jgi:hypothetical protein
MNIGDFNIGTRRRHIQLKTTTPRTPRMATQYKHPSAISGKTNDPEFDPTKGEYHPNRQMGSVDKPHMSSTKGVAGHGFAMERAKEHPKTSISATGDEDKVTGPQRLHRQGETNP